MQMILPEVTDIREPNICRTGMASNFLLQKMIPFPVSLHISSCLKIQQGSPLRKKPRLYFLLSYRS